MKFNRIYWVLFFCFIVNNFVYTQEQSTDFEEFPFESFSINGYVKFMETLAFSENEVLINNLIHNRLNFAFYTKKGSSVIAQFRNRIFFGEFVNTIPDYGEQVNSYEGVLPLEWLWVDNDDVVANTIVDRLYYEYTSEKFQLRAGRQRINWGINTTWNPNDIFNSYNIYDFDYEEREGADALRATFFPNYFSSFDMAYKFTGNWDTDVFGFKYKFNKWNYDLQFLAGKFEKNVTVGLGWAGSLKLVGFKGEVTYFNPYDVSGDNNLSASTSFDYAFASGFYVLGTYLFNSTGTNNLIDPSLQEFEIPNAANLMPAKHNMMIQGSYPITPIFYASLGTLYSFGINNFTLFPTLSYGILTNLDFDLIGQFFWQETTVQDFQSVGNVVYWRFKYSF